MAPTAGEHRNKRRKNKNRQPETGARKKAYQPAQKWLKDRRARALSFDDVKHYQCVIKVLTETDRIMQDLG